MRWAIVLVASLILPSSVMAQTQPSDSVSTPEREGCHSANPTTTSVFGMVTTFTNCVEAETANDYGRVHIQWLPPEGTNPADQRLTGNRRDRFLRGLRRFLGIQNNGSGAIILEVYNREGATVVPATSPNGPETQSLGTLIYTRALAAYEINEAKGLQVTNLSGDVEGPIGPYVIDAPHADGIEWRVTVMTSERPVAELVQRLQTANKIVGAVTGSPLVALGETSFARARDAQTEITELFTSGADFTRPGSLSFAPGTQVATARISLAPVDPAARRQVVDIRQSGFLRLKVTLKPSLFAGVHEVDANGLSYRWGIDGGRSAILNQSFNGRLLNEIVSAGMGGGTTYQALQSTDAGAFQVSCQALSNFLTSPQAPRLNQDDMAAVRWAFGFSGANIANPDVRQTACAQAFLQSEAHIQQLTAKGLTIPPVAPAPAPSRYQLVRAQAEQTAAAGALDARKGEDAYALQFDRDVVTLETETQTFEGVVTTEPPTVVGRVTWRSTQRVGDRFSGYALRADAQAPAIIVSGYGRLEFADNPASLASADLAGSRPLRFNGYVRNGLPSSGRLQFEDNSYFDGLLVDGQPFEGVYVRGSGTTAYGRFARFKLDGDGLENAAEGLRWGVWVNGTLPIPNPGS